jgi:hypothetical protein
VGVMRLIKLITLVIVISVFASLFVVKSTNAVDSVNNLINANFNIELESATNFSINIEIKVNKLTLSGSSVTYTGEEIEEIANTDQLILGAIEYELQILTKNTLTQSFEKANVKPLKVLPNYENSRFYNNFSVDLTYPYFNMDETVDIYSLVNGVLDMGAYVNYSFILKAEPGWNNNYKFNLDDSFTFVRTTGSVDGTKIGWDIENSGGNNPDVNAEIQLKKVNPTTSKLNSEDIFLEFILNNKDSTNTILNSNILLRSVDIRDYNIIPDFINNLNFLPADGIRLFINNGLLSWDLTYENTIKSLQQKIKSEIEESSLNQTLDLIFIWDNETTTNCIEPYNVLNMDDKPNIKAILTDNNINLKIFNISSRTLYGLINSGADASISKDDINFGDNLNDIGHQYNITLLLPNNVYLDNKNVYTWNDSIVISGKFKSDTAVSYKREDKNSIIEIDVKSSDLNLISFLTAKTELTFGLDLNANKNYYVTTLPNEFDLPNKIILNYLNSDGFRLCIEENVFDENRVNNFLNNEKSNYESLYKRLLPGLEVSSNIRKDVFDKSLEWDKDISKMDANNPIRTSLYGHCSYPISFDFSIIPPNLDIPAKIFNFTALPNENITYKIIFPNGISIDVDDPLNRSVKKELSDGRQYFEISFSASDSNLTCAVSCKMTPSALFIIGIFIPCIVGLVITIILIILIIIIRRKRKQKQYAPKVKEEDLSGYEGEDYYIPPPPNSK